MTRCPECGGTVSPLAKEGRFIKHYDKILMIPPDILILTCEFCKEEWWDESTCEAVTKAAERFSK